MSADDATRRLRWRLVLGGGSEHLCQLDGTGEQMDGALGFLYDREYGAGRNVRGQPNGDRSGGMEDSTLAVPGWLNDIHRLFPRETIERLEKDALERYGLDALVTDAEVLKRVQPSMSLLKAVLHTKHLMNDEVLAEARRLIRKIVNDLLERLARPVRSPFLGARDPRTRSRVPLAANFDARATIRRNLRHWDAERGRIVIEDPVFVTRVRRHVDRWQVIICVDQSGSMAGSVIHAAVTASIFFGLRHLKTHLVAFDTNVVDLSSDCRDPVETLMKVQLGGGTDIGQALSYAAQLVQVPRRTIVVLITDFYEGGPVDVLLGVTKRLVESGVTLLGLAALDEGALPSYDRDTAGAMVQLGTHVAAMTPHELAAWVAEKIG